ncbi:hypothetical protein ACVWW2_005159 [Bradyrhizobium sp. LM4.3]
MSQTPGRDGRTSSDADESHSPAPITAMLSSRLMVLANLLKRGAMLRYKRLAGLSSVEFGLVASLGRRPPMSVARLAEAVGQDKGQISRALAETRLAQADREVGEPEGQPRGAGLAHTGRARRA